MATKLQTLATFWQNFGLAKVQKSLDDCATEITVVFHFNFIDMPMMKTFFRADKTKVIVQERP